MTRVGVSQGYSSNAVGAPRVPEITKKLPFTKSSSFRSDSDVLRDVFAGAENQQPPRASSIDKRKLPEEEDDDINLSDDDFDMANAGESSARPIKPLRSASKRAIQSLPTLALMNNTTSSNDFNILHSNMATEEDDWSKENFV